MKGPFSALFWLLFATFAYFYQGGFSNQNTRYDLSLALAYDGSAQIDSFHENTIDKAKFDGHYFAEKAPGASYLALPVAALTRLLVTREELWGSSRAANLSLHLATVFAVSLLSALGAVFFAKVGKLLNPALSERDCIVRTAMVYLGTLMLPYSTVLFGHQIAATFLILGVYALLRFIATGTFRHASAAVLAFGFMVFTEYPTLVLALPMLGVLLYRAPRRSVAWRALLWGFLPFACLLLHNTLSFRSPFALGYGKLDDTPFAKQMAKGVFGLVVPSGSALVELLFGVYRGLFAFSPVLLVTVRGCLRWGKASTERPVAIAALAAFASLLLLNSSYVYWQGGLCLGPRHLVAGLPLLALGIFFMTNRELKSPWALLWILLGVTINVVATSTTLFVPESELNPLKNAYLKYLLNADLSNNPMSFNTPFEAMGYAWGHSQENALASYNLGERLGLRGWWSLVPLISLWVGATWRCLLAGKAESSSSSI